MKRICAPIAVLALICTLSCPQAFAAGETVRMPIWTDYPEYNYISVTNVVSQEEIPITYGQNHEISDVCDLFYCDTETTITALDTTYSDEFVAKYGVEPIIKYWVSYAPWDGNKDFDYMELADNYRPVNEPAKSITLSEGNWIICHAYSEGHLKENGDYVEMGGGIGHSLVVVKGSTQTPQTPQASSKFTDVDASAYYAEPVAWAVEKGITSGTSSKTFSPNDTCTRAQIMTFLWRAAGSPEPKGRATVTDVKASDYFYKAVMWAAENKMFNGSAFAPNDPCTRAMAVEFMWKQAGSPKASGGAFTDVPSGVSYAAAVSWALEKGVTAGTSKTTFSPDTTCSRAQIVTFLYRGMK